MHEGEARRAWRHGVHVTRCQSLFQTWTPDNDLAVLWTSAGGVRSSDGIAVVGPNRIRWNDRNGVDWKYFCDINVVGRDYKKLDTSKWNPLKSGLLGPVEVRW